MSDPASELGLRLFIIAGSPASRRAVTNLRRVCDELAPGAYELEVVDLVEHPEQAETHGILAAPTLIRTSPEPRLRLIGDLSDRDRLVSTLGLG